MLRPYHTGGVTKSEARKMLKNGFIYGKPLTKAQIKSFKARLKRKEEGGLFEMQNGGNILPHVTVTGHPDKETRDYYELLKKEDYAAYSALTNIGRKYGFSKIRGSDSKKVGKDYDGFYRAHTNETFINRDLISNFKSPYITIEELAHKIQYQKDPEQYFKRGNDEYKAKNYLDNYDNPNTLEYEAHSKISPPIIKEYRKMYEADEDYIDPKVMRTKKHRYGGLTKMEGGGELYDFLFGDDDEEESAPVAVAKTEEEISEERPKENNEDEAMRIAMSEDWARVRKKYYNPTEDNSFATIGNPYTSVATAPSVGGASSGSQKGMYAFNYFQKQGLAPHIAAGIVGNLEQESGNFRDDVINGTRTGDNDLIDKAYGIAQWRGKRWTGMQDWAKKTGQNPLTLDAQLGFVLKEAKDRGDLQAMQTTKTTEQAARLFALKYERPKIIDQYRINYAKKYHP